MRMAAFVVGHAGLGQQPARLGIAADSAPRPLVPLDVEGPELGKEAERGVGKVVVNPPRQALPAAFVTLPVPDPGNGDAGGGPHAALRIAHVPDMVGCRCRIGRAVEPVGVAEGVHRAVSVGRADVQPTEGRLERLQKFLAKFPSGLDRQFRIVGDIRDPVELRDFGVKKIAQEKVLREAYAPELFERFHRPGFLHASPASEHFQEKYVTVFRPEVR